MNNYKYHYHFTSFDIETFNLENFKYNFVNMTSYRMVDVDHQSVKLILKDMEKFQPMGQHILNKTNVINIEPALMYDSVYALARGLQALERGATLRPANVSCEEENPWNDGSSLFNYVNSVITAYLFKYSCIQILDIISHYNNHILGRISRTHWKDSI